MTLGELIRRAEGLVPEADEVVIPSISTTKIDKMSIFNEGVREFVKHTDCMPKKKRFNCVASTSSYSLTSNVSDYYKPREGGLWHNYSATSTSATSTYWERCKPVTARLLDTKYPSWRDDDPSDFVDKYWIEGDMLYTHYTPSTSITNGFEFYYYGLPTDMSALTHYPFTGSTSQENRFSQYDRILLVYYEYRALGIMGYKSDATNKELEFYQLCEKAKAEMQDRPDIAQDAEIRPKSYISRYRGMYG